MGWRRPDECVTAVYLQSRLEVYRYLVMLGLPAGQAQEITQDSFVRLYEALLRGETIENLQGWVFRVAHNLGVNVLKALGRGSEEVPDAPVPGPSVLDRMIEEQRYSRLRDAIGELSTQQRACLELRVQGFRYREIGQVIGISTSTVSEFLQRAIARLRRALDE